MLRQSKTKIWNLPARDFEMNKINSDTLAKVGVPKRFQKASKLDYEGFFVEEGTSSLYIDGPTGSGKTHLACAILRSMIENGYVATSYSPSQACDIPDAMFVNTPEFLFSLRESMWKGSKEESLIAECSRTGLLVMDDLGAEKITEWALECLYLVINKRYEDCLPCIFTGNLPVSQLSKKLGQRIARRIEGMSKFITPMNFSKKG